MVVHYTETYAMIAKHLFVLKDAFNPDSEVTGGATGLVTKYGPRSYSTTTLWINGGTEEITTDGSATATNAQNAKNDFPNRVGVYLITHMNNPFVLAGAKGVADMICDYLNTRNDLGINCTMLDKVVLVTCTGSDNLKHKFYNEGQLKEINKYVQKQDAFYGRYKTASVPWDQERQKVLDEATAKYEGDSDNFLKDMGGNTMVMFACALDKRGAHPKIAAWDSGLYVRADGRKSIYPDKGQPVILRSQRLLNKMMIQFTRQGGGQGSIRQLGLQEWSDKG
jgi:hypothetical protein